MDIPFCASVTTPSRTAPHAQKREEKGEKNARQKKKRKESPHRTSDKLPGNRERDAEEERRRKNIHTYVAILVGSGLFLLSDLKG
jgi:hypothetical protein